MKITSWGALLALVAGSAFASPKGFNIAAERPDGSCKAQADWENNFNVMKSLPGGFNQVRVYASSDCGTLANAVPAAMNTGIKLLVGVWTENSDHYNAEKQALLSAAQTYGVGWISAISVGSEDLYRGDTSASTLAQQIYDVRGMMTTVGGTGIPVGHVDTWTAWVNNANNEVINATDFIGFDGYPYWQGSDINDAYNTFQQSLTATQNAVNGVKSQPIWITETGWPVAGPNYNGAVASVANGQQYWDQVMCGLLANMPTFAYVLRDYQAAPNAPSFGVVDVNFNPIYNLGC